ncbi:MAG: hypothetical protein DRN71_01620 [Candidatus Nanohalarchaeota archaeon]|nr:MAG: hypothetical protein DRN71_01620 [Candidatus Nanohaloarchaeota archaeon]
MSKKSYDCGAIWRIISFFIVRSCFTDNKKSWKFPVRILKFQDALAALHCSKKHRKSLLMFDIYLAIAIIMICVLIVAVSQLLFTKQSIEALKFSDEHSAVDTHLYVLLNNNYCTPLTNVPLKVVLGTILADNPLQDPFSNTVVEYNNQVDTFQIGECISDFAKKLQIDEFLFSVSYNDVEYLTTGIETEDMTIEREDIAVPPAGMATVTLMIKKEPEIKPGKVPCPQDDELQCVPQKSCALFGGICKNQYICSPAHCCCKNLPV